MLQELLKRLYPCVHVTITPTRWTFACGQRESVLKPVVYLSDTEFPVVLSVGEDTPPDEAFIRVVLFEGGSPSRGSKTEALRAFLNYGFQQLFGRSAMVRPFSIVFHGVDCLEEPLCGYHKAVLRQALGKGLDAMLSFEA